MTQLSDVFSLDLLAQMQQEGMVRRQVHPTEPYSILNYTEKSAFSNVWNSVTLACRGLIYNHNTMEIVARPFKKFMNYGQSGAAVIGLNDPVVVSDKQDGSLGIFYRFANGNPAIATRGSFTSEQSLHATLLWYDKYIHIHVPENITPLFEIVYPQNRIVLDYGDMDDLVLLGAVNIDTGQTYTVLEAEALLGWTGKSTEVLDYRTMAEALAAPPRPNAEGLVVHSLLTDERIKIKQEDYIALHKIVTNLSERSIWEGIVAGKTREDIIAPLPDEFHEWAGDVITRLEEDVFEAESDIRDLYEWVVNNLDIKYGQYNWGRKEFAEVVIHLNEKWAMFLAMDNKWDAIEKELWKRAKPEAFLTPSGVVHNEDTA